MRSQGTKETQGINGDAAILQRWAGAVAGGRVRTEAPLEPCPYPHHRGADWRLASGGPIVCGICHPPAAGLDVDVRKAAA